MELLSERTAKILNGRSVFPPPGAQQQSKCLQAKLRVSEGREGVVDRMEHGFMGYGF